MSTPCDHDLTLVAYKKTLLHHILMYRIMVPFYFLTFWTTKAYSFGTSGGCKSKSSQGFSTHLDSAPLQTIRESTDIILYWGYSKCRSCSLAKVLSQPSPPSDHFANHVGSLIFRLHTAWIYLQFYRPLSLARLAYTRDTDLYPSAFASAIASNRLLLSGCSISVLLIQPLTEIGILCDYMMNLVQYQPAHSLFYWGTLFFLCYIQNHQDTPMLGYQNTPQRGL